MSWTSNYLPFLEISSSRLYETSDVFDIDIGMIDDTDDDDDDNDSEDVYDSGPDGEDNDDIDDASDEYKGRKVTSYQV